MPVINEMDQVMSWDVYIQDFSDFDSVGNIPDDFRPKPIGKRSDLIRRIKEVVPTADFSNPEWGILDTNDFSIEFNMGSEEEIDCIFCYVRGVSGGSACIATIVQHLGLKAFDTSTGEFLDLNNPEFGFEKWKEYRDKCMRKLR